MKALPDNKTSPATVAMLQVHRARMRLIWRVLLSALVTAMLVACASGPRSSFKVRDPNGFAQTRAQNLSLRTANGQAFAVSAPVDKAALTVGVLFGPIGGMIGAATTAARMQKRGAELMSEFDLSDPAKAIAHQLRERLAANHPNTPLVDGVWIEIRTSNWTLANNELLYSSQFTLQQRGENKPIASGNCYYASGKPKATDHPTEFLLTDNAAPLKALFTTAATHCASYVAEQLFGQRIAGAR